MEKPSWVYTLLTQICLCLALYLSFHLGERHTPVYQSSNGRGTPHDLYFLSVRGGYRFPQQQFHLLQRMEKVAKTYKAKFVVNISELGDDDPLMQNGTLHFPSLKVPWYTTTTSQGERKGYFLKQVAITHGQVLDIIGLDTGSVQGYQHAGKAGRAASNQLQWLTRILGVTDSNWCIVAGFHPLAVCEEEERTEMMHVSETLQRIFLKFGVNAYLSQQGCSDYTRQVSITNIGIPGLLDRENNRTSSINTSSTFTRDMHDGFILHRVSPLEIVSYSINSAGQVVSRSKLHQRGKDFMSRDGCLHLHLAGQLGGRERVIVSSLTGNRCLQPLVVMILSLPEKRRT
ncbi:hypothetical protein NE237_027268 [Protea cynaroides]|uniref:Uncharacterized protein n=1 Tax=Protea cynaroides TaxID=273540 RepID=A0A9Q0GM80_9MAGN|nr:hypothetical protein NE237_027268 [Protea cynaroides]